jgi:hypothetical protein
VLLTPSIPEQYIIFIKCRFLCLVSLSVDFSGIETKDLDWSFFSPHDLKHWTENLLNRATRGGYWKVTGKDQEILSEASLIGKKKISIYSMRGLLQTTKKLIESRISITFSRKSLMATTQIRLGFYLVFCYYWLHISF